MTTNLVSLTESKLRVLWSPQQISGWLRDECNIFISHESICVEKVNFINHVAKISKLAESLSEIESALMNAHSL